jgi:hypothetical protein
MENIELLQRIGFLRYLSDPSIVALASTCRHANGVTQSAECRRLRYGVNVVDLIPVCGEALAEVRRYGSRIAMMGLLMSVVYGPIFNLHMNHMWMPFVPQNRLCSVKLYVNGGNTVTVHVKKDGYHVGSACAHDGGVFTNIADAVLGTAMLPHVKVLFFCIQIPMPLEDQSDVTCDRAARLQTEFGYRPVTINRVDRSLFNVKGDLPFRKIALRCLGCRQQAL